MDEKPVRFAWLRAWRQHGSIWSRAIADERGQTTVEYAVVMVGFLSLMVGLSALWHAFDSGLFVNHALSVASHHIQLIAPVTIADLFLY